MDHQNTMKTKAVFLDRDGTLNADSVHYIKSADEFHLFNYTADALRILTRLGYMNILITNQSALGRNMITVKEIENIHLRLKTAIRRVGAEIHGIYYCPHLPDDNCECRKPKIGNLEKAIRDFNIDIGKSFFIGDSFKDIQTGAAVGCRTIFVRTGIDSSSIKTLKKWNPRPDFIAENLLEAAQLIECIERNRDL
ncbi:MAG: HAD-IIIA family hydrolase [Candidatus Marinimicrobia bacterium]|nr:HAD-IIIA family hydrolase [Candidatus Neomarinimicrobiota bacterium]